MFILRVITGDGLECNSCLGKSYNLIDKIRNPLDFEHTLDIAFKRVNEEHIYAFIVHNDGADIRPLYKNQKNFIMTESGKTFSNVSK